MKLRSAILAAAIALLVAGPFVSHAQTADS